MPHYCIVQLCNNRSGTPGISFYHLPLKDLNLPKQWLVKIRRENVPLNEYSRVCSEHFEGGKKVGKKAVPTVFVWTKPGGHPPPQDCSQQLKIPCKPSNTLTSTLDTLPQSPQSELMSVLPPLTVLPDPVIEGRWLYYI